jgi:hypothetical protein
MIERLVLQALEKGALAAIGTSIPIKFTGRNISPPTNGKWWEVVYIPNNTQGEFWSEGKTYRGVMRLILHWPQDNQGALPYLTEVDRVSEGFRIGTVLRDDSNQVSVKITSEPTVMGVIEEAPQNLIPLTIRYLFFKI